MHGDLEHRAPYDPKKAHEYYMRTRKLKGRKKGKGEDPKKDWENASEFLKNLPMAQEGASRAAVEKFVEWARGKSDDELKAAAKKIAERHGNNDGAAVATINHLLKNRGNIRMSKSEKEKHDQAVASATKRVNSIKEQISELNSRLKEAIRKADASERKPTAADKAEAARDSKKYRKKHKQELKNKAKAASEHKTSDGASGNRRKDAVESLRTQLSEARGRLNAAKAKLDSLKAAS